ncbi:MAG: type 1 glutamine amidotransferase [Myxococcota bacterium]|nr:type 1 glutamine amidotransferase [Myxococcota bacterium]
MDPAQIHCVDLLTTVLTPEILKGRDALLVGGSGDYSVLDPNPSIRRFIDFLGEVCVLGFPTFASCFGFQALALALGGEVVSDPARAEVGSYTLQLTDTGRKDPVFQALPQKFIAQLGHKDHVTALPAGVLHLAGSALSPFQALRVAGKPIYATQFHPELTWKDNRQRYLRYMSTYGALFGEAEAQERLESHVPGPEANTLLAGFARTVLS